MIDIIAFSAHPDDVELGSAGTLILMKNKGYSTAIVDLTVGEKSTCGSPEIRLMETQESTNILKLTHRENTFLPDTSIGETSKHRNIIIEVIRRLKPKICLIPSNTDRHPDHIKASRYISESCFYSGLAKIDTTCKKTNEKQSPWRPHHIFLYMQDSLFDPHIIIDISSVIDIKEKAVMAFKSQFLSNDTNPKTYLNKSSFLKQWRAKARIYGHQIGVEYGEPYRYQYGAIPMKNMESLLSFSPLR